MKRVGYLLAVTMMFVLGYGYWYAQTHAWLDMDLDDEQGKHIRNAQLFFYDERGQLLAKGKTDNEEVGIVYLRHPIRGYCERSPEDQNTRWRECLKEHSEWQATWLPHLRAITIHTQSCELKGALISADTFVNWGLWWVPMPHMGGLESTRYRVVVKMNRSNCTAL
jgi:hypothetical protein